MGQVSALHIVAAASHNTPTLTPPCNCCRGEDGGKPAYLYKSGSTRASGAVEPLYACLFMYLYLYLYLHRIPMPVRIPITILGMHLNLYLCVYLY
jgi:hypothetical protein